MMRATRAFHLAATAPLLAASAAALTIDTGPCSPANVPEPRIWVQPDGGPLGTPVLRLENGPPGGVAWLVLMDGSASNQLHGPCAASIGGTALDRVPLGAAGEYEWPLPPSAFQLRPRLVALCVPQSHTMVDAATSNVVLLPAQANIGAQVFGSDDRVIVTEFMNDPTTVSDTHGEWIEVYNPMLTPLDIEGWVLSDDGSDSHVIDVGGAGLFIPPTAHVVLGRDSDPLTNGGMLVHYEYAGFTLGNTDDEILVSRPNGTVADAVRYQDGGQWPDGPGNSVSLDPAATDEVLNDDPGNWCLSSVPISPSNSDTGTPGVWNENCGG